MNTRLTSALIIAAALGTSAFASSYIASHDQNPKVISQAAPVYQFDLRKAGTEGAVLVSFNVTAQGDVADAIVVSSTDRAFEEPTLKAVKQWKFAPATKAGQAVSVPVVQLITYTVPGKNPETPTIALVGNLQLRIAAGRFTADKITSTDLCYCGSGKKFVDCHGHGG